MQKNIVTEKERFTIAGVPSHHETHYQIFGNKIIWVCKKCQYKELLKGLLLWPIIPIIYWIITLAWFDMTLSNPNLDWGVLGFIIGISIIPMLIWSVLGVILLIRFISMPQKKTFKRNYSEYLKSLGAKEIFTEDEYEKLSKYHEINILH